MSRLQRRSQLLLLLLAPLLRGLVQRHHGSRQALHLQVAKSWSLWLQVDMAKHAGTHA